MEFIFFEWDEQKNQTNQKKHGVSFEEAETVFWDEYAILYEDPDHSVEEDRFLIVGETAQTRICLVCYCYREQKNNTEVIRIISARPVTKREMKQYLECLEEYLS